MKHQKTKTNGDVSRRDFFKTTGAAWVASQSNTSALAGETPLHREPRVRFVPSGKLTRISPNLFALNDSCNVYLLKNGDRGLLIDFGSGRILQFLGEMGISKIDGILHTHHHRDQCQGDAEAVAQHIPIYVPAQERYLFEDAENFWRNRHILDNYAVRNDFFTLTKNIQVADILRDYETFRWGNYELLIFPTPGHTLGAISLVGQVDGRKVAFTGDPIHSPGKVVNLYELQYGYQSADGVDCAIFSLTKLRELGLEMVCPSHGEPFESPEVGITNLVQKLKEWYALYSPDSLLTVDSHPFAVSPHLACAYKDTST